MAELLEVPLKKPSDVDVVKPLSNLIASTYSTADKPEDYSEQIEEFSKLRAVGIWRAFEKYESSLEPIYRYYDQIQSLETKIPPSDVQIPFKWKDAFNKASLFGGRISLTLSSLSYERVCVLFNIAALQSSIASNQSIECDDGLKLAAKLLQQASGIFDRLKNTVIAAVQVEPTPDLNPETLGALSILMLAQAQEMFVHKAIRDKMKDGIIAKLASQCEDFYAEALKLLQKESVRHIIDKDWIGLVAGKQAAFHGLAEFYQSLVCKENKAVGEEIARLQKCLELLRNGQARSGKPLLFQEYVTRAEKALKDANKDNDFIYHERIPDSKLLSGVPRAPLAKATPLPDKLSKDFKDLFGALVPVPVHQALAAYEVRKSDLVNREISELRKATELLNSVLASLNLPAALEESSGEVVPQSIVEKSRAVQSAGGLTSLDSMINELPLLLQRNTEILNESERLLYEEQESDDQLREQFKEKWTRTPSSRLTDTFRNNIAKYRQLIDSAIKADKVIREKYDAHKRGMQLLSDGVEVMTKELPLSAGAGADCPAAATLSVLMEQVETMKAERDTIESELKSATTDMKESFLRALAKDSGIDEAVLSTEALGRTYGPLQLQVKDSILKQQSLLNQIQEVNTEFSLQRDGVGGIAAKREETLKELAASHAAFEELRNSLEEGTKFYNSLTELLVVFQNKISDFCFARKTEKEELMKDLTQNLSKVGEASSPAVPSHVANVKKDPPPRPPPPSQPQAPVYSSTLPYPSQQGVMPMPYAPYAAAPYPTPLPMGYNPYATLPTAVPMSYNPFVPAPHGYNPYATYPGPGHHQQPRNP